MLLLYKSKALLSMLLYFVKTFDGSINQKTNTPEKEKNEMFPSVLPFIFIFFTI